MKKYISTILITLAIAGSSCKKTYLSELANNPNTPAVTTPALQLTGALTRTATITNGTSQVQYLAWDGYMAYSTSFQPSPSLLLYSITTDTYDNFTSLYLNISNYNSILKATTNPNFIAIAKIMIAYDFQQLVDQYNNVPYSSALDPTNLNPSYDNGSAIYDDLVKQLDAAINMINTAPATSTYPGKSDLVYGATDKTGMLKWAAFANTLKLRLAIHQSSNTALFATKKAALTTSIAATASFGYLTTSSEGNVQPGYTNTDVLQAPLDVAYGFKASGATQTNTPVYQANTFAINFFVNTGAGNASATAPGGGSAAPSPGLGWSGTGTDTAPNDPRLFQIYAKNTTSGTVVGTKLGETQPPGLTPSRLSSFVLNPTKAAPLISAAESYFLQAEAIKAGLMPGGTLEQAAAYNNGVTASFIELGLTGAQASAYLATHAYPALASDDLREEAIITQKWASFDPYNPLEAYTELRRTGYPKVPLSILTGVTATQYVQRLPYPTTEFNTNGVNVSAQAGGTDLYSKIFWAK
ncbi:SusD/RagB family nutrient-binding outer membrane lipoprotein [Mucilaginibacter boryungensis]|uniref:SusD/RagB family nutrient-binding outer membrane lipoprotein n=1 Tax=Mucilaginibacter boryungensis TaxID=768480 RepID=A0ABR9XN68_9SPHI|nr:SusD/RagB family nutrient-binding outer membrane lipoprotein [Mucilaginibacter boryungensis]MBE9668705.1 SusD/RagB family nutrient-binding outer membrane lipoprotein [Mucilaginibacter boryungensis]